MREFRQFDMMIELVEGVIREHPDMSGAELLDKLRGMRSALEGSAERATCRHCGHPIYSLGDRWQHEGESGNVGCRAASFDRLGTWDDSLDKAWKASPRKTSALTA